MKRHKNNIPPLLAKFLLLFMIVGQTFAQDSTIIASAKTKVKPVKNTFGSVWLMDNQTVMVPIKGTLEFDIQHRFGTVKNGSTDLWGMFAPSNIRLGLCYTPIKNLMVGTGITKERMQADFNVKYSILQQNRTNMPVSVSYFANVVMDTRAASNFRYNVDRYSYFNQLIIARKITENFSAQVSPTLAWYNNVEGYVNTEGLIKNKMNNYNVSISVLGRYKITEKSAIIAGYDQPLTQHPTNNPHPNICFGFETTTSAHAFQVFFGNYAGIVPQSNSFYNQNDYSKGEFLLGFNITRLWNF